MAWGGLGKLTSKLWFYWSVVFEVVSVVAFAGSESLSGCYMCVPRKGPQRGRFGIGKGWWVAEGVNNFL